jgi:hypothetical protein
MLQTGDSVITRQFLIIMHTKKTNDYTQSISFEKIMITFIIENFIFYFLFTINDDIHILIQTKAALTTTIIDVKVIIFIED